MKFERVAHILGSVFKVYSLFLLIPFFGSLYWDEDVASSPVSTLLPFEVKMTTASFAITFLFVFLLGFLLTTLSPKIEEDLREREAFFIVGAGWMFCSILGAIPFLLTRATRDPTVALFEAMSGITTTGFTALQLPMEQYADSVHLWRGAMQLFGGLGIVLVAVAVISRLTEGAAKLLSMETGGAEVARLRPKLSQTAKTLFGIYLIINVLCFVALWIAIHTTGVRLPWKRAALDALIHSFTAVATGGFSNYTDSAMAFQSTTVNAILWFFMAACGVSFVLYYRTLISGPKALLQHPEFRFYVFIIAATTVGMGLLLQAEGLATGWSFGHAAFTATSAITTTGLTIDSPTSYPDGAKLVILLLMFTGGMIGSTAGGLKVARIYLLLRLTWQELQRLLHPHAITIVKMGGRVFPDDAMRRTVVFFFCYVTIFIAGALALAGFGYDLETSLSGSAATLGNVGFGFGAVSLSFGEGIPAGGRLLGTLLMWLGRLEIFAVLLLFVPGTYRD